MKVLRPIENAQVQLEVIECDCGYHIGLDATYTEQVEDVKVNCPSCKREIDTALIDSMLADFGAPEINPAPVTTEVVKATKTNIQMAVYLKRMPDWLKELLPRTPMLMSTLQACAAHGDTFDTAFDRLCRSAVTYLLRNERGRQLGKADHYAQCYSSLAPMVGPFRVIEVLKHVLDRDPDALHHLLEFREPVSEELADGDVVFVTIDTPPRLGLIGLLNGLFGQADDGSGFIRVHYDGAVVTGFSVNPNAPKPRQNPGEQKAADWDEFKSHEERGDKLLSIAAAAGYGADDDLDEELPPRTCSIDGEPCESCT
jgi:hypothetical protein